MSATAVAPTAAIPAGAAGAAQVLPELQALVQRLPADQQGAALAQLQAMNPAQQQQLLGQVMQAQQAQQAQAGAPTAGSDQAALGAQAATAGPAPSLGKTILKNVAIFGGIGAALGFGASFIPGVNFAGPILAAIGGGVGAVIGAVKGFLSFKKAAAQHAQATNPTGAQGPGTGTPAPGTPAPTSPAGQAPDPPAAESLKPPKAKPKPAASDTYTVKKGDTLSKIAQRHKVDWHDLFAANKQVIGKNPNLIRPGQRLQIP